MNQPEKFNVIGSSVGHRDGLSHVSGLSKYSADWEFGNMVYVAVVRSTVPRGIIKRIDLSNAEKEEGFIATIDSNDVPKNMYCVAAGLGVVEDEYVFAEDKVNYVGEPIIGVIAETRKAAMLAASKVKVTFKELPAVLDMEYALKPDSPILTCWGSNAYHFDGMDHRQIRFGDVDSAFGSADHIVEGRYKMSPIEHAPIETQSATAVPNPNGRLTVYTNTQALFFTLDVLAGILQLPTHKLRFKGCLVGGGFGGKVDTAVEPYACLAALKTGRPAKYQFTRKEEMVASSTRGAWCLDFKDGVMNDGRIIARKVTSYHDSGAYNRLSPYAVTKHVGTLTGPYTIPNVSIDAYLVTTNRAPSSAMRGFGVVPSSFGVEIQMDKMAKVIEMCPWRFRLLNAYRNGDMKAYQKETKDAAVIETIQAAAELCGIELDDDLTSMNSNDRNKEVKNA